MHHFAGEAGDPQAPVEAGRSEPEGAAGAILAAEPPEADVVAPPRAPSGELFEGEVLRLATRDEVCAHRRGRVGAVEEHATRVAQTAAERDAIGLDPSGCAQRGDDLRFRPHERDVDRVCRNPLGRIGEARESPSSRQASVPAPDGGQDDVSERRIRRQGQDEKRRRPEGPKDRGTAALPPGERCHRMRQSSVGKVNRG